MLNVCVIGSRPTTARAPECDALHRLPPIKKSQHALAFFYARFFLGLASHLLAFVAERIGNVFGGGLKFGKPCVIQTIGGG